LLGAMIRKYVSSNEKIFNILGEEELL
jgi:hypothetical protein